MRASRTAMYSALAGVVALGVGSLHPTGSAAAQADMEKCYGIAKAGKNDCATGQSSCAGTTSRDGEGDRFIVVPKGTCDRIVGGSTEPKA